MCNHYQILKEKQIVLFEWSGSLLKTRLPLPLPDFPTHIYPKYPAPVIIQQGGERNLVAKHWGIPMKIKGATKMLDRHVTNARNDKLGGYPWRFSVEERRCLIPATGYFEPGLGPVGLKGEIIFTVKEQPFFYFAGLWDCDAFTMVTTDPNDYVQKYHDRMPVILAPSLATEWLGDEPLSDERLRVLCQGLPTEALQHEELPARLKITKNQNELGLSDGLGL